MEGVYPTTSCRRTSRQRERKDGRPDAPTEAPVLLAAALLNYAYIYSLNSIKFSTWTLASTLPVILILDHKPDETRFMCLP